MTFLIADTFTDSLGRLTGEEQKAAKTAAFDLQMDPTAPGLSFHKLDRAKDKRFWSVRVNRDVRVIVHRTDTSLLLCYVDHHDKAYDWAERRKIETHPATGAAQIIELRESVRDIVVPNYIVGAAELATATRDVAVRMSTVRPLANRSNEELLGFGVPAEWLEDIRAADEDGLLVLTEHLPAEAAEAVLELATGGTPQASKPEPAADPFTHPDAQRRFRVVTSVEELERALDAPWDKWAVFLHPEQRDLVTRTFTGPARVTGSAGTGKTVVALHRAVHLARSMPDARVLLATFSEPLAHALRMNLRRLAGSEPRVLERLEVQSLPALALKLHQARLGDVRVAIWTDVEPLVTEASMAVGAHTFSSVFLRSEWEHVIDAWQLRTWEDYRDVQRLGRRTRLGESARVLLWRIFEQVLRGLETGGLKTETGIFQALAEDQQRRPPVFDAAVVDEAQDVGVTELRWLAAMAGGRPNGLFFAGDLGQRIFQQPFSWKALGVDVRGRSKTLRVNYRTSHQIRQQADRLLGEEVLDADGNAQARRGTVSVFNGPVPIVRAFPSPLDEATAVGEWLAGVAHAAEEVAVFVRSADQIPRAIAAVEAGGRMARVLDERVETAPGAVNVATMHLAKGLEFRAVAVMACDDEVLPLQTRIEAVGDTGDLDEVYDSERYLLYVACTRAREQLLVTGVDPVSEFLGDIAPD